MNRPKLGPTGDFALGAPIDATDRGGLYAGLKSSRELRVLALDFDTDVDWLASSPREALEMAALFRQRVREDFGELSFDATALPFRVTADVEKNVVVTTFSRSMPILVANPEVWLAWAQRLEEEGEKLS